MVSAPAGVEPPRVSESPTAKAPTSATVTAAEERVRRTGGRSIERVLDAEKAPDGDA
jgi:hypothetical protein